LMCGEYCRVFTMRTVILLTACLALASAKSFSKKALATPMARGGGRIVGGEDAEPGEFPHQIMLTRGVGGSLMCGGSLVAANKVVTAAHCCDGQSASYLGVEVGSHNLYEVDPDQTSIAVEKVTIHENYDSYTTTNDICLLTLAKDAELSSDVINTIELPEDMEEYEAGTECFVTGWGATTEGGSLGQVLQKVTVPVVSDADCRKAYGERIADSMICAGFDKGGKDSCQGDSGGPFMCGNQLSGIVSWGRGCAEPGYPGVYTQTSHFVSWVNNNL